MEHGVAWKLALATLAALAACGCEGLRVEDAQSLLRRRCTRSELLGLVARVGTTFAAIPDLLATLRRRSSAGDFLDFRNNERHAAARGTT
jgi:hypothetical protein